MSISVVLTSPAPHSQHTQHTHTENAVMSSSQGASGHDCVYRGKNRCLPFWGSFSFQHQSYSVLLFWRRLKWPDSAQSSPWPSVACCDVSHRTVRWLLGAAGEGKVKHNTIFPQTYCPSVGFSKELCVFQCPGWLNPSRNLLLVSLTVLVNTWLFHQ